MSKRKLFCLLLSLTLIGSLTACGGSGDGSASPAASSQAPSSEASAAQQQPAASASEAPAETTPAASGETIRIGIACPLTGTMASYGELMVDGAQIAIDDVNAAGGVNGRMLELVPLDDKHDPKEAALVAQRFCDDQSITAVISHGGSTVTLAAVPIYEKAKMPNMSPCSNNAKLTELGNQYYVRNSIRDDRQSPQVVAMLKNNLGLDKIAIIYANSDYGQGNLEYASAAAADLDCEIVASETYNPGLEKDFSAMLAKIQKSGAQGVALYADHTDGGLILGQAHQLGLDIPFVGQSALTYQQMVDLATPAALGNVYICVTFNPYSQRPAVVDFMDKFTAIRPDQIPSEPCAMSNDIIRIFAQAMSEGATKENLAQWIKNISDDNTETFMMESACTLGDNLVWDEKGDVQPLGVSILRVSPEGKFISSDEKVDITGLSAFNIVE